MAIQKMSCMTNEDYASITCDDSVITALKPLCEGEISVFVSSGAQGTLAPAPLVMNTKTITGSKMLSKGCYSSNTFRVPNVKTNVNGNEIRTAAMGKLKADLQCTVNATNIKVSYDARGIA